MIPPGVFFSPTMPTRRKTSLTRGGAHFGEVDVARLLVRIEIYPRPKLRGEPRHPFKTCRSVLRLARSNDQNSGFVDDGIAEGPLERAPRS